MRFATDALLAAAVAACAACTPANPVDDPTLVPPVFGEPAMDAWLGSGFYLHWACDAAPHVSSGLSPHGAVRTCGNPIAAATPAGSDWPVDSAWVMELYDGSGALRGHSVQRRSEPADEAASWYWFEAAGSDLAADGWGFEGPPLTVCSACHQMAGVGSNSGRDFDF